MSMRSRLLAAAAAVASLVLGEPAFAQLDMVTPQFQTQTFKNVLDSNNRAFGHGASGGSGRSTTYAGSMFAPAPRGALRPTSRSTTPTTYRASPAVSQRVQKQFADFMAGRAGAEGGRRVAEAMRRTDPVRNWSQMVASDGLRPGDTADALAAYWVLNWVMANRGDNNRAQTLAVREQVRPMIASNPAYSNLNEGQRQEFAEVLMLNFLVQQAAYTDAMKRGDQRAQQQLGDAAVARFRNEMGVDLRTLTLTQQGLIQRR
jgi:hypothetical protein